MKRKSRTSALPLLQQTWHSRFACLRWSGYSSGTKAFNFHPGSGVFCAQTHNITSHSTIPEATSLTRATLTGRSPHFYLLPYRATSPLPHTNNFTSGCLIYCKLPLSVEKKIFFCLLCKLLSSMTKERTFRLVLSCGCWLSPQHLPGNLITPQWRCQSV